MSDEVRLIDANALKESLKKYKVKGYNQKYVQGMQDAIDGYFPQIIDDAPTVDVQPVKYGWWMDNPSHSQLYSYICSNCRNSCDWTYRYCPNCGSKNRMDGDSE